METRVRIDLPAAYRVADVLAFHGRDAEGVAEQVGVASLRKGVMLGGVPTLFEIEFDADAAAAHCRIVTDAPMPLPRIAAS